MAKREDRKNNQQKRPKKGKWHSERHLSFSMVNYVIFVIGIMCIIIGFVLLSRESMTVAPFLLVIGYSILVPLSVLPGLRRKAKNQNDGGRNSPENT